MKISQNGINVLIKSEGYREKMYLDSGGEPTIGIGHLLTRSERHSGKIKIGMERVEWKYGLTEAQVYALLDQDLYRYEGAVNTVIVPLNQNQFDALVNFSFNIGKYAFLNSTLYRILNDGDYDGVPAQMRRWKYDNGKIVQVLVNRREREIKLWLKTGE